MQFPLAHSSRRVGGTDMDAKQVPDPTQPHPDSLSNPCLDVRAEDGSLIGWCPRHNVGTICQRRSYGSGIECRAIPAPTIGAFRDLLRSRGIKLDPDAERAWLDSIAMASRGH